MSTLPAASARVERAPSSSEVDRVVGLLPLAARASRRPAAVDRRQRSAPSSQNEARRAPNRRRPTSSPERLRPSARDRSSSGGARRGPGVPRGGGPRRVSRWGTGGASDHGYPVSASV